MFDDVKKLIEDAKALRIGDALRTQAKIANKLADLYDAFVDPKAPKFAVSDADLDANIQSLESCYVQLATKGDTADPKDMSPEMVLFIVKSVIEVLKMIREWRKNR